MRYFQPAVFLILLLFSSFASYSQCSTIRQQRNITFNTDKDCAPVSVTDFTITYFFNVPQDPSEVTIRFDWKDPGNNFDEYSLGDTDFSVDATNTEFTAIGKFTYPENDQCVFLPVSSIIVNGESCETSKQTQIVTSWSKDNDFGGNLDVAPSVYDVCYGNAIDNALFTDNSTFNCNINLEPDNPNRQARHTQFVYGTNHNAANSIRNLSLVDDGGTTIDLTDNSANLSNAQTINGVTGTYFGEIVELPFPADGPEMVSFPISAPADVNNVVGSTFEITLYNWNICNPFNGDNANPNYADAVETTAYITIVDPPVPDYQTRLTNASGPVKSVFCLGETVYFENLTTGGDAFTWEFYDDAFGTNLLNTSSANNPTYVFTMAGDKLIRLYADDTGAEGACEAVVEKVISLSPSAVAQIGIYDGSLSSPITPEFCADDDNTQSITIGFKDETTNVEPQTEWRWEFYDQNGNLNESIPSGSNVFGARVTDFTRDYSTRGEYLVRLIARNSSSQCESVDNQLIYIYDNPEAFFEYTEVCAGERSVFSNITDPVTGLSPRVNSDSVAIYEWDLSYDGVNFNPEVSFTNNDAFEFYLDGSDISGGVEPAGSEAGTYTVALQVTTAKGSCSDIFSREVAVNPLPEPILSSDYTQPICPGEVIGFFNDSDLSIADYELVIYDSLNYQDSLTFNQADTVYSFENTSDTSRFYHVELTGVTIKGCRKTSPAMTIEVLPSSPSGFNDLNYSVVSENCSVWESTLVTNNVTQNLNPDQYTWTIADEDGVLPGYPVVKNVPAGDPVGDEDFHRLDYTITNNTGVNRLYDVTLDVMKSGVCITSSQNSYIISPQPISTFEVGETEDCTYETVALVANQKGLADYDWYIDPQPDQLLDEGEANTLIYLRPSPDSADLNVDIRLITENLTGCRSDTTFRSMVVEALEEPLTAHFDVDRDTVSLPENTIGLTNNSSTYGGVNYLWGFGDGQTSTTFNPGSHSYDEPGIYRISLLVSNRFCEESYSKSIVVEPAEPIIDFSADILQGCAPLRVNFSNESEYAEPGTFYWEFGDGKTSPADEPSHVYARSGVYTVTLYGENRTGRGSVAVKEAYIEVFTQPIASFALTPKVVYVPGNPVYFRNSSENAASYHWEFGDGNTSEDLNPLHYYENVGSYDVRLIVQNDAGCSDTLSVPSAVKGIEGGDIKTPNAFTPSKTGPGSTNGGGETVNDVFIPKVEGVAKFRMLIYNKWGQLLFESLSQDIGWDGYFNGQLQPSDVYVYKLELTYTDGRQAVKVGDVTLVK